jgi:ABC-type Fe3+/spermidine/putrescine transport system ATPase subunit
MISGDSNRNGPADSPLGVALNEVTVRYGSETVALDRVSIEVKKGEMFFLLGPSGCGKSTLLRAVAGFVSPSSGSISIGGRPVGGVPPHIRNTGMVFQNYALFPHLTVAGNVAFGLRARKASREEQASRVSEALRMVGLEGFERRRPGELSGGQQQRVALARALAIRPEVLLLDEPLSNLDARLRLGMREEIRLIHRRTGVTTIYVTHDQREALSLADRIAVLDGGRLVALGTPEGLYYDPPNLFTARFMGDLNAVSARVETDGSAVTRFGVAAGARLRSGRGGRDTRLFCRPEEVRLMPPDFPAPEKGRAILVRGTVASRSFQGDHCMFSVRLEGAGDTWTVMAANPRNLSFREGDAVTCLVDAASLVEIPES